MDNLKEEHPIIISASRRTDIPGFHMDWFIKILKEGRMLWTNPFNAAQKKNIYFDKTRLIVFWSKDPGNLINSLDFLNEKGIHYYLQYTLNPYPEYLEPLLPPLDKKINLFKKFIERTGMENAVWRFDPVILTSDIDENYIYDSILSVSSKLKGYAKRLVISFLKLYPRVKKRLIKAGVPYKELNNEEKLCIFKNIGAMGRELGMEIMSCADTINADNELESAGIKKGRCIDPDLIKKLFNTDKELMKHLENVQKDKGQRPECGCIQSIDIGTYNTCSHNCLYCYAGG